ncbi:MAG: hypothetical protein R3F02_18600 [Thiolinea sp.]
MSGFTSVLPEEFHALIGVSDKAFRLYLYLRQFMIRSTGTAAGSGVTWPDIARNGLYIAPSQGVQGSGMPDKRKMMRLRDELIRGGLMQDVGDKRSHLAFYFPIFMQNRDRYFSAQNKPAPIPHPETAPIPHPETADNTGDTSGTEPKPAPTESGKPAPYTEVPDITATTGADFENWKSDPLAAVMLEGGMNEFHVVTGLHITSTWRELPGYSETSAIALIRTRLSRNPNVNSVAYFTGAIQQMCHSASNPKKPASDEYRVPKDDGQLVAWAEKHGYLKPGSMSYYEYRNALWSAVKDRREGKPAPVKPAVVDDQARLAAERQRDDLAMEQLAELAGVPVESLRKKV